MLKEKKAGILRMQTNIKEYIFLIPFFKEPILCNIFQRFKEVSLKEIQLKEIGFRDSTHKATVPTIQPA